MATIKFTDYIDPDTLIELALTKFKNEFTDHYDEYSYGYSKSEILDIFKKHTRYINQFYSDLITDFMGMWVGDGSSNPYSRKMFKKMVPFLDLCKQAKMSFVTPQPQPKFIFRGTNLRPAMIKFIKKSDSTKWKPYKDFMYYSGKRISYNATTDVQSWTTNPATALDFAQGHNFGAVMATNYDFNTTYFSPKFIEKIYDANENEVISNKTQYSVLLMVEFDIFNEIKMHGYSDYKDSDKEIGKIFKGIEK